MFTIEGNNMKIWQPYDGIIAVELRVVHMMGCAYLYMVHVVLLRVYTQFYFV